MYIDLLLNVDVDATLVHGRPSGRQRRGVDDDDDDDRDSSSSSSPPPSSSLLFGAGSASAILLIGTISAGVEAIAPDLLWNTSTVRTLSEVIPGTEGITIRRLVALIAVRAVDETVTEERARYARRRFLATVLIGRTQTVFFVRFVPAVDDAVASLLDGQTRGGISTAEVCPGLDARAFTVAFVARVVAVRVAVAAVRVRDTLAISAPPLVRMATCERQTIDETMLVLMFYKYLFLFCSISARHRACSSPRKDPLSRLLHHLMRTATIKRLKSLGERLKRRGD